MKKFTMFLSAMMLAFLLIASPAFAGFGYVNVDTSAKSGQFDFDWKPIPNGGAVGVTGSCGKSEAEANGFVLNGSVGADIGATGGGVGYTDAYRFNPHLGDKSIGVGSFSYAHANTGAYADVYVDPSRRGFGIVGGQIQGCAVQGTLNASYLTESPIHFTNTTGFTGGIAGQGSIGSFEGGVFAVSGPDYKTTEYVGGEAGGPGWYSKVYGNGHLGRPKYFPNGHPTGESDWRFRGAEEVVTNHNSQASAGVGANIDMEGFSYSESWRYVDLGCGWKTEAMGTNVGAETHITSSKYNYDWANGLACANSCVRGGWSAVGGAATKTVQTDGVGGYASASAVGFYTGQGSLGTNFDGSAHGYSQTSITSFNGMNGSMISSSAGMHVTSQVSRNHPEPQ